METETISENFSGAMLAMTATRHGSELSQVEVGLNLFRRRLQLSNSAQLRSTGLKFEPGQLRNFSARFQAIISPHELLLVYQAKVSLHINLSLFRMLHYYSLLQRQPSCLTPASDSRSVSAHQMHAWCAHD